MLEGGAREVKDYITEAKLFETATYKYNELVQIDRWIPKKKKGTSFFSMLRLKKLTKGPKFNKMELLQVNHKPTILLAKIIPRTKHKILQVTLLVEVEAKVKVSGKIPLLNPTQAR